MLNSLEIKNFRMLRDFKVSRLGQLNLIVGKNNSGKSTVLEAIRLFAGNGRLPLLRQIARSHDEKYNLPTDDVDDSDGVLRFQHFFTGRVFPENEDEAIVIGESDSDKTLRIQHAYYIEEEETITDSEGDTRTTFRRKRITRSEAANESEDRVTQALVISSGKRNTIVTLTNNRRNARVGGTPAFPAISPTSYTYVPTQFISMDEIAADWDRIALSPHADSAKEALRIVAPDLEDLVFVNRPNTQDEWGDNTPQRVAKVKLKGIDGPIPLASMGDGMLRVLQLILKVFPAAGGYLLIDEFENGLHYSVQEKIWDLLFRLARDLNVQVFATTHSWDCIESFAKVAVDRTDIEGVLFRVGRSVRETDRNNVIATVFDEERLLNLTQSDVEVR
ncbi:AAA family ATPase [Burkholderia cenocepacia]|uniref:AAA family ATPase n=1 Tax=Burkholderia cenocepacia TaxID=95486 RepID=UPI0009902C0D|nr:ATP-binding protein [Burkholderia cenocepacia]